MKAKLLELLKRLSKKTGMYGHLASVRYQFSDYQRQLKAEKAFYASFVRPGALVFDVGANVGRKTQAFLELGAHVVAFEPQPECAEEILLRCGNHERLTVHQCALGAEKSVALLDVSERSGLAKIVSSSALQTKTIEVEVYPLERFVERYGMPSFCKIDVEGFELQVLRGLSELPDAFSIEYHTSTDEQVADTKACLEHILGYEHHFDLNYTRRTDPQFVKDKWLRAQDFGSYMDENWHQMPSFGDVVFRSTE